MKAIIVLDITDCKELLDKDIKRIEIYPDDELPTPYEWEDGFELKSIPQKKDKYSYKDNCDYQKECTFRDGFNACIDEILGEKE